MISPLFKKKLILFKFFDQLIFFVNNGAYSIAYFEKNATKNFYHVDIIHRSLHIRKLIAIIIFYLMCYSLISIITKKGMVELYDDDKQI
jgi:hypothetical protein